MITGPAYLPIPSNGFLSTRRVVLYALIGENGVAVPTHFYKVMLREKTDGQMETLALLIPHQTWNGDVPLDDFVVSIDEVEQATGLDFFNRLNDTQEKRFEATPAAQVWE